jgi:hypothetical protein
VCGRLRVGKGNLHVALLVGAAMCSAFSAVHITDGHNALRGSGPGQNRAFDNNAMAIAAIALANKPSEPSTHGTFVECALDSGQFQAAVLTGCWAWRSSYCANAWRPTIDRPPGRCVAGWWRWRGAYLARLNTASVVPPAPDAGLTNFSSSAVRLTIERFPSVPSWFG